MKKIKSVFERNYSTDRQIRNEVVPGSEWVLAGEGIATRKYDGAAVLIRDGVIYKRYDARNGKTPPIGFEPLEAAPDPNTGHWPGWLECRLPTDVWIFTARGSTVGEGELEDGTYEVMGPHYTGRDAKNPEHLTKDVLIRHGVTVLADCPRDFDGIREYLRDLDIEGVVFHHHDGRMAKVKKKDYGLKR